MVKRGNIEFIEAKQPITEPVTKFGGQPVWVEEPQWPISRSTGKPMRFICQIALDPELFGDLSGKMAYLFITDDEEYVDETWDPEAGENAVVVQPGNKPNVETRRLETGPTLYVMVKKINDAFLQPEAHEFEVRLRIGEDPNFTPEVELWRWKDEDMDRYSQVLAGNKVGGTPGFMQFDQFPEGGPWRLLLQLDSTVVPFYVNFGDAGIGYAFITEDGHSGRFLWQCA